MFGDWHGDVYGNWWGRIIGVIEQKISEWHIRARRRFRRA